MILLAPLSAVTHNNSQTIIHFPQDLCNHRASLCGCLSAVRSVSPAGPYATTSELFVPTHT